LLGRTIIGILLGAIPVIGTSANGNWAIFWSDHHAGAGRLRESRAVDRIDLCAGDGHHLVRSFDRPSRHRAFAAFGVNERWTSF
jgi:hypothetical protein